MSVRWSLRMEYLAKQLSQVVMTEESLEEEAQAFIEYCHQMDQYYNSSKREKINSDLISHSNQLVDLLENCYKSLCNRENVCCLWK